jgi:murein L,D-transpeptidase YcbB/YkuD
MENDEMTMARGVVLAAGASLLMGLFSSVAPVWALNDEVSSRAISTIARPEPRPAPSLEATIESLIGGVLTEPGLMRPVIALDEILPEAIRSRLDGMETLHPRLDAAQRDAVIRFYEARGFASLWIDGTQERPFWNAHAKAIQGRIQAAGEDALEPSHYALPTLGVVSRESMADLAKTEIALSLAAILYARDARGARIDVPRLHKLITPELEIPDSDMVLGMLAGSADAGAALHAYNPQHRGYVLLRERLADLRINRPTRPVVHIPEGPILRVGMRDARVPLIRARFGVYASETEDGLYDRRIASAVEAFQRENGLAADGIIGQQTMAALLAEDPARQEGDIIANMERWRWLPSDLGTRSIVVNIPEYMMRVMDGDVVIHEARSIVGRTDAPTPVFSDRMNHIVVNPSWTIPPTIMRNEVLPGLRADPDYALKKGYEVIRHGNNITVRQPPGPNNALGMIKFMFPNGHHVYLHDTPSRGLFNTLNRAHSSGCVRIENPFKLADILLADAGWGEERLRRLVGGAERTVRISPAVPVHLTYFTLTVDDGGQLRAFADVYRFNQLVRDALGLKG